VREFKGIQFAEPPVEKLRRRPPATATGIRKATGFGPRCTQQSLFGDMNFRADGMSKDCLSTSGRPRNQPMRTFR
jgi:para-nitrobenzyl esterase